MSAGEHHTRVELLEQNPALLREVETVCEHTGTYVYVREKAGIDVQLESTSQASTLDDWPEPVPLGGELPSVPTFDVALLPNLLRSLVEDTAERMQVPLDYPAVISVLCLAGVTNRRAAIQPKAVDTSWIVVPNLWGGIVAPPGLMKSPVISSMTQPLTQIESLWRTRVDRKTRATTLNAALVVFAGAHRNGTTTRNRKLSAKGRTPIAAAQKARWKK